MDTETIIAAAARESQNADLSSRGQLLKVALVCDYLEERWPSMDLFGDMLHSCFEGDPTLGLKAALLRPPLRPRWSRLPIRAGSELRWNADRLLNRFYDYPRWLRKRTADFDLFHLMDHSYGQLILSLPAARTVVTCHDLDTFKCVLEPEAERRPRWFRAMAQRALNGFLKTAHVICVSEFTRANLLRHGLFPAERITIIPPGADPVFFAPAGAGLEAIPVTLPPGPYLLHVGSTIRRKRIDVLLRVFARVLQELPNVRLVRVGGDFTAEQAQLVEDLDLSSKIVQAPRLTTRQLASVYRKAALLLQTSDAEGFGLPVIEAMACGCPVVASDIPPLREAGGSAAEYCPAGDVETWSGMVLRVLREQQTLLPSADPRRSRARRHASGFTWMENAKRTIDVYRGVLGAAERRKAAE